ncbi:hypothetical protein ABT010_04935 [Streptomyces sp. NPDC002668]|uniref:hypothetical protein n=1 Tax=Streptomyces sp. NPDC002668 TaxID=3154422 RepID=UPI0033238797
MATRHRHLAAGLASTALALATVVAGSGAAGAADSDRDWSARNDFGSGRGRITVGNGFTLSGSVTDKRSNPSTTYVYVSWREWKSGGYLHFNERASGSATNGTTKSVSYRRLTPNQVDSIRVTVCTSAGGWYCGSPG